MRNRLHLSAVYPLSHRLSRAYRCLRAYSYWKTKVGHYPQALLYLLGRVIIYDAGDST